MADSESGFVTIEGDTWRYRLTKEEYAAWVKYDESHPWLNQIGYEPVLRMFLTNYRLKQARGNPPGGNPPG